MMTATTSTRDSGIGVSSTMDSSGDKSVINYYKELLKGRIFLGRYMERRLVDESIGYRDIVVLSPAESELKRDLIEAQQVIRSSHTNLKWIGITDSSALNYHPSSPCLWTEIENQPFGLFWFQVKTLQIRNDLEEIIIKVKCLRYITDAFLEAEPILTGSNKSDKKVRTMGDVSLEKAAIEIKEGLQDILSIRNVKEFTRFVIVFVIALFTGSVAFVSFLGNFILSFTREASFFMHNSTPMFLGFLNFMSKIVGGFYLLLAMMFKQSTPAPPSRRSHFDSITYKNHNSGEDYDDVDKSFD